MSENTDTWYSIPDLKKNIIDYQLSELVDKGCCIRCMNNTCNNKEPHGEPFPEQITYFLSNPLRINLIRNAIKESELDINGFPLMFNLCHFIYTNKNCINCAEGRFKTIKIQGEDIRVCYSDLKNVKNKLTVGLHIDLKFSISNKRININKVLPYDKEPIERKNIEKENTHFEEKINLDDLNSYPDISKKNTKEFKTIDYSKIKNKSKEEFEEKNKKQENITNDNNKSDNKNYINILKENNYLRKRINDLEDELDRKYYEVKSFKNRIYDRFDEIEYLNNRVITQYFDTNLQDYINNF